MELGEKLRQARLEAGLSQRQLCGDEITRNMLSLIENGSASPSMATLRYLAGRLGKNVSYFLEEAAVTSPNQPLMEQARAAYLAGDHAQVLTALEQWREPDPVFRAERQLLEILAMLALAETAIAQGRYPYAEELLERAGEIGEEAAYYSRAMERRRLLLLAKARPKALQEICAELPGMDEELLLRAGAALEAGDPLRCAALLEAAEDHETPDWNFLRGEAHLARGEYAPAAGCFHRAEAAHPEKTAPRLERCYRELEDFRQAYLYACKQR